MSRKAKGVGLLGRDFGYAECEVCGKRFHKKSGGQKYCSKKCFRQSAPFRLTRARQRSKRKLQKTQALGRECRICNAKDTEVTWSNARELCQACERARHKKTREGIIGRGYFCQCGRRIGPLGCPYCFKATKRQVDVLLLSKKTEETKIVRRDIREYIRTKKEEIKVKVKIAGKYYKVLLEDPAVWLSHEDFVNTRI